MRKIVIMLFFSFLVCCNQARKMEKTVVSDTNKNFPIDSIKIDVTSDHIPDYLIFDEMDYNSPVLIFDGKNGSEIQSDYIFTSHNFSVETLDINCTNPRKALRVITQNKTGLDLNILQYDSSTHTMNVVFNYPILISQFDNSIEKVKDANYIDFIYSSKKCIDTITISKGKFLNYKGEIPIVKPLDQKQVKIYIYNIDRRKFEEISA